MATYVVGDLQGCLDPLRRLLDHIHFEPGRDTLWIVGDLVNRGPQSLAVLRFVRAMGEDALTVLGNHDLYLLMQSAGYGKSHKDDTLGQVLNAPDRDELIDWLRRQPLFHVSRVSDCDWALVHAGLLPAWDIATAAALANEVCAVLQGPDINEFLANMWGSQPDAWSDDLAGWERLRVVVNAMTRMRFVTPEGRMVFRAKGAKGPPERGPKGCLPWFAAPGRKSANHAIVCGHWSALGLLRRKNLLTLDTGCLWGGKLTAVRLDDRRLFQIPCDQSAVPNGWQ